MGNYALFGGGNSSNGYSAVVDAYNTNLVRTTPTSLSEKKGYLMLSATTIGEFALFGGGFSTAESAVVDAYNTNLVRTTATPLSQARSSLAATTVGNYALFGGGIPANGNSSIVDSYYTILAKIKLGIYPQSKYKFQNMQNEATSTSFQVIEIPAPVTGYIKIKNITLS